MTEHVFIPLAIGPYGIYNIHPNPQPSVKEVYLLNHELKD